MKLHGFWRSTSTWRVRIALAYKNLAHEYVPVDLLAGEGAQNSLEHRQLNPMAQVPVLELEQGLYLTQSIAILEYLEERWPKPPLLPRDPLARVRVRQLTEVVNAGIQPLQNTGVERHVASLGADPSAWIQRFVGRGLAALEAMTLPLAGRYSVGDALTFADLTLVPELAFARRVGVDLSRLPTLLRVEANCAQLDCFKKAHADAQPDAPR
ncbi:maleylacetoacetate isomerase [Nannocystis bainbridge]|uniref:Maleylacetoacetate isomerase n=1 Tax=Nannocystis bainbridge TaxID=2995303 RepID=A0ABT5EA97_9BACT|nr:maleylacetoacetate isomerase [Nannocystis bainbridge]MDC0722785.1 maleylacetoacetate isomerase [Nannocystis bainbridge]